MLNIENAKSIEIKQCKSGSIYKTYIFECIDCGDDIKSQQSKLKIHSGKCKKCTQRKRPYEHILSELFQTRNKKNKHEVEIIYEEFIEIIKDSKCHYCNKILIFNLYSRDENLKPVSKAYQLDRKDNDLGYTKENVVPCCWNCNRLKSDIYSYEDFIKLSPILKEIHNK